MCVKMDLVVYFLMLYVVSEHNPSTLCSWMSPVFPLVYQWAGSVKTCFISDSAACSWWINCPTNISAPKPNDLWNKISISIFQKPSFVCYIRFIFFHSFPVSHRVYILSLLVSVLRKTKSPMPKLHIIRPCVTSLEIFLFATGQHKL